MAKIVVTTISAEVLKVEFNDYFTQGIVDEKISFFNRRDIEVVKVYSDLVTVHVLDLSRDWQLSDTEDLSNKVLQIDNIDGTTSWADIGALALQIANLMK